MQTTKVNVAPSSTSGHYIENAKNVVALDNASEIFFVEGPSILTTKNHTTIKNETDCLITPQLVFNPFTKGYVISKD
jgi:hypothetical protein